MRSGTRNSEAAGCCCGGVLSCRVESSRGELSWCRIQVDLMQRRLAQQTGRRWLRPRSMDMN